MSAAEKTEILLHFFFPTVCGGFFCDSYVILSVCIETKKLKCSVTTIHSSVPQYHHAQKLKIHRQTYLFTLSWSEFNSVSVCRKTETLLHRWCQCHGWGGLTLAFHQGGPAGGQSGTGTRFSVRNLVFTLIILPLCHIHSCITNDLCRWHLC
jgi:hypothetical protein